MSGFIPPDFINKILDVSDIITVIESYTPLKKSGNNYVGRCPFCQDPEGRKPALNVNAERQLFNCFKCPAGGNVIGFIRSIENTGFVESIEVLASKAGLEVPYEQSSKTREDRKPIFQVLKSALDFYANFLANDDSAERVREYVSGERQISPDTCKRFSMGYAPHYSDDTLTSYLSKSGFTDDLQIKAGLAKVKNNKLIDFFRGRLMFPIRDRQGRTVGFGGRVMDSKFLPKYLNSPNTAVFTKGKELYGLFEASQDRRKLSRIYVVEGYMDVVSMSENGITNTVATLGVATSDIYTQRLLQLVNEVIFCFDGDKAGRGAAWSAFKKILSSIKDGAEIKFQFLPENEDPASLLEKESKEVFEERLKNSLLLSEYFSNRLSALSGTGSLEKKASLATQAMDLLKTMPNSSIKKLLELEVSKVTGLALKDIEENSKFKPVKPMDQRKPFPPRQGRDKRDKIFEPDGIATKALMALITYPHLISEIHSTDWIKELNSPESSLFLKVVDHFKAYPDSSEAYLLSALSNEYESFIASLLSDTPLLEEKNSIAYFQDCLKAMKKNNPIKRTEELKSLLKEKKLSEDETFELQQHLLLKIDDLDGKDKELLRNLSTGSFEQLTNKKNN